MAYINENVKNSIILKKFVSDLSNLSTDILSWCLRLDRFEIDVSSGYIQASGLKRQSFRTDKSIHNQENKFILPKNTFRLDDPSGPNYIISADTSKIGIKGMKIPIGYIHDDVNVRSIVFDFSDLSSSDYFLKRFARSGQKTGDYHPFIYINKESLKLQLEKNVGGTSTKARPDVSLRDSSSHLIFKVLKKSLEEKGGRWSTSQVYPFGVFEVSLTSKKALNKFLDYVGLPSI